MNRSESFFKSTEKQNEAYFGRDITHLNSLYPDSTLYSEISETSTPQLHKILYVDLTLTLVSIQCKLFQKILSAVTLPSNSELKNKKAAMKDDF